MKEVITMTNKITYRELYSELLELEDVKSNPLWVNKLNEALAGLDRKASNKTASKTQIENEEIKISMLENMESGTRYTCLQMIKILNDERVASPQKASSLFSALEKEGKVERIKDKKSTYFVKID